MATRRSRAAARRRRKLRRSAPWAGAALALTVLFWSTIWPYLLAAAAATAAGGVGWKLWHTHRTIREKHRRWQHQEQVHAGHRTLTDVDGMSGGDFEDLIAALCRRDGCSDVKRVGGTGDNGADVRGRLPDGRTVVIQCKRYAAHRPIAARDMRELAGARGYFHADVAVFVTTSRFTPQALKFATADGIIAIHRDHLGQWNKGTPLSELFVLNGTGQGDRAHHKRWRTTYDTPSGQRRRRRKRP